MRIVADTNTVVSGLLWQGAPRTLIDLGRAGRLSLLTSVTLIDELARVLDRAKFKARIDQAGLSARSLVEDYSAMADVVTPAALSRRISVDPDDDAVRLRASRSGRRHRLRRLRSTEYCCLRGHPDDHRHAVFGKDG